MSDLPTITQKIAQKIGDNSGLGKIVKLDFGSDGIILIDGANVPNSVSNDDGAADATVQISIADLMALENGSLDPMMAFMTGKMKVQGDLMAAQKLAPILKG